MAVAWAATLLGTEDITIVLTEKYPANRYDTHSQRNTSYAHMRNPPYHPLIDITTKHPRLPYLSHILCS